VAITYGVFTDGIGTGQDKTARHDYGAEWMGSRIFLFLVSSLYRSFFPIALIAFAQKGKDGDIF